MPTRLEGDRFVRLLKKIADQRGLLLEPDRMARELDIPMTFETRPGNQGPKSCEAGGFDKSMLVTKGKAANDSWYRETSEGIQNMQIPPAFINQGHVAGKPEVRYEAYRSVQCKSPSYTSIRARLSFNNLSGFSCLTPDRLQRLIGAKYEMYTDGVSGSTYSPPATNAYGVSLEFIFRLGAPCAVGASVELDSRGGFREQRAFLKWRACLDKAGKEFCAARGGKAVYSDLRQHQDASCESQQYIEREPLEGDPPGPWPDSQPTTDNACEQYAGGQK